MEAGDCPTLYMNAMEIYLLSQSLNKNGKDQQTPVTVIELLDLEPLERGKALVKYYNDK